MGSASRFRGQPTCEVPGDLQDLERVRAREGLLKAAEAFEERRDRAAGAVLEEYRDEPMDVIAFDPEVANDVLVGKTLEAAHLPLQRLRGLTHRIRWLPTVGNLLHSHELAARRVQTEVHAAERAGTDHLAALPRYGRHHERAAGFDLLGALREPRPMPFGSDCFVYDVRRLCLTR